MGPQPKQRQPGTANRRRQPDARLTGRRLAREAAGAMGQRIRAARTLRKWRQAELARKVGISQAYLSLIEHGRAEAVSFEVWFALSQALQIPLRIELARDRLQETEDAGHLAMQELALRLGRSAGFSGSFELATRSSQPALSVDVRLRDDRRRLLVIIECWNTFGNIGAAVRSTRRKVAETEQLAIAVGGERGPYRAAGCWIVRDTARNRALISRYPEIFAASFPASSRQWVRALTQGDVPPPPELGLVWCDGSATRLRPWRRSA